MQGSKYPDEVREQALAMCSAKGMTPKKVAEKLNLPPSTVYDWCNKADKYDPEYVYNRQQKKKKIVDRAMRIVDAGVTAIAKQVSAGANDRRDIDKLLAKIAADPYLTDDARADICAIVREYTGIGIGDLTRAVKEISALESKYMDELTGKENTPQSIQISFADMCEEAAE